MPGVGRRHHVGDEYVWAWYRGTGIGPSPCTSALRALERAADQLVQGWGGVAAPGHPELGVSVDALHELNARKTGPEAQRPPSRRGSSQFDRAFGQPAVQDGSRTAIERFQKFRHVPFENGGSCTPGQSSTSCELPGPSPSLRSSHRPKHPVRLQIVASANCAVGSGGCPFEPSRYSPANSACKPAPNSS